MPQKTETIRISVIVPCRNEENHIEACLGSLLNQTVSDSEFEIIFVDGKSSDKTNSILKSYAKRDDRIKVLENPLFTTPTGMNLGIQAAQGRYIAIMGAHNRYDEAYLYNSKKILEDTGADNVGGAMFCEGDTYLQMAIASAHHSPFSVGGARWHNPNYEGPADTVFGGVYRREVFDRIGLFDEEFIRNQDDELNLRLIRAGGKIWQSPRMKSWYKPRTSLRGLFLQYRQYGYWKVRVIQKHKLPASMRHLVPGSFVFLVAVLPLLSIFWPSFFLFWIGLIGTYAILNLLVSTVTAFYHGRNFFPILPLVFACYHFGYGLGFLEGILDFLILRRHPNPNNSQLTR